LSEHRWKVADAKARLSEVLSEAQREPQIIENRGRAVAAIIGVEAYRKLKVAQEHAEPQRRLAAFLRYSAALREGEGPELEPPPRRPRRSPFEG
jgi:prevent-host-death family protein